uniref:Uncharacterized protein n=1 Tax=Oryza meridionalis TaxID=40149 RepID=A0A0E0E218_9ORYZ
MCAWQQRSVDGWAVNGGAQGRAVDGSGSREARVEVGVGTGSGDGDRESRLGATVGVEAAAATMERYGEGAEGTSAAPPSDACTMQHNCASSASPLPSPSASAAAAQGGAGREWRGGPNLAVVAAAGVADAGIDRSLVHRLQRGGRCGSGGGGRVARRASSASERVRSLFSIFSFLSVIFYEFHPDAGEPQTPTPRKYSSVEEAQPTTELAGRNR